MKNRVTEIISIEIELIESEMERFGKHVIRTATLKDRCMNHLILECGNDETQYLTDIGFGQAIQSGLYTHGYRSVRRGMFVNLERCESLPYLQAMEDNEDLDVKTKQIVLAKIKALKDGQSKMKFDTEGNFIEYVEMPNENDFIDMLEADAI